jgi:hypothetical protein
MYHRCLCAHVVLSEFVQYKNIQAIPPNVMQGTLARLVKPVFMAFLAAEIGPNLSM